MTTAYLVRERGEHDSYYLYEEKPVKLKRKNREWGNTWPWHGAGVVGQKAAKLLLGRELELGGGPVEIQISSEED